MYTDQEKIQIITWYNSNRSLRSIANLFAETYLDRPTPNPSTIARIVNKFKANGCIKVGHQRRNRIKTARTEERRNQLEHLVEQNCKTSTKKLAVRLGISKSSTFRLLKQEKYHCYRFQNHQELRNGDCDKRILFCQTLFDKINNDENFLNNILFTDEATFVLSGEVNSQNVRYWSRNNLHLFHPTHTQYPQKVNVWAGLVHGHVIGPFFIEGNLNSQLYLELLQNRVIQALLDLNIDLNTLWFQHDGAPAHSSRQVREYLNTVFPHRWIGRGGEIEWPPRSPDLAPNDFSYWGFMKSKVFNGELENIDQLKRTILEVSETFTPQIVDSVLNNFYNRLICCLAVNGEIFENLL